MSNSKNNKELEIVSQNDPHQEDIDKFFNSVNGLKESLGSISNSLISLTSDRVSELNEKTRDYSFNWLFDLEDTKDLRDVRQVVKSMFAKEDEYFPKPYEVRDKVEDLLDSCSPWGHSHRPWGANSWGENYGWGDFFGRGRSPFGYSHKSPSIRSYNDCLTKNGESVWDSKGHWRCLFPDSEIPIRILKYKNEHYGDKILTKEDFESAVNEKYTAKPENGVYDLGEKGVFFKQFEDLMNWKTIMYQNAKNERRSRRAEFRNSWGKFKTTDLTQSQDKQIVSSSVQSTYNTDSESKQVEMKEIRTDYFSDGTSVTKEITKSKPVNATDWVTVVESEESSANALNGGWFWKSGKN